MHAILWNILCSSLQYNLFFRNCCGQNHSIISCLQYKHVEISRSFTSKYYILIYYWASGKSEITKNILPLSQPGAKRNLLILFFRGLIGGAAVVSQVYSLQYLNIADSTVICFSTPVFVAYLAHFILGEPLGIVPIIISIYTLAGVVIITRPPILTGGELSGENLIGIGMALTSMLTSALVLIILRYLRNIHTALTTTSFGSVGMLFCVGLSVSSGVFELPQGIYDWIFAITLGGLTFSGQIFFTLALQYEEAGPVSLVRPGDVIFAFIWQFIFLGIRPDMFSIIGAVIVISGVLIIGIRKGISDLPEGNQTRKRFWFLLL